MGEDFTIFDKIKLVKSKYFIPLSYTMLGNQRGEELNVINDQCEHIQCRLKPVENLSRKVTLYMKRLKIGTIH